MVGTMIHLMYVGSQLVFFFPCCLSLDLFGFARDSCDPFVAHVVIHFVIHLVIHLVLYFVVHLVLQLVIRFIQFVCF